MVVGTPFLLVMDVDSTLINEEAIDLLADEAGSLQEVAAITQRAMAGELDFADSLRERVWTLRGLPLSSLDRVRSRITRTEGAAELIAAVQGAGGRVAAVSGGFHEILDPLAREWAVDEWRANRLEVRDGQLTGEVRGPIIDAAAKAQALREWAEEFSIPAHRCVAVGDGANDIEMMRVAGLSVAFDAHQLVRQAADVSVGVRDLANVIPLLGLAAPEGQ